MRRTTDDDRRTSAAMHRISGLWWGSNTLHCVVKQVSLLQVRDPEGKVCMDTCYSATYMRQTRDIYYKYGIQRVRSAWTLAIAPLT